MHDAVVRDVASEVTGEAGRVSVATIEDLDVVAAATAVECLTGRPPARPPPLCRARQEANFEAIEAELLQLLELDAQAAADPALPAGLGVFELQMVRAGQDSFLGHCSPASAR